jgi:hypothetical protein
MCGVATAVSLHFQQWNLPTKIEYQGQWLVQNLQGLILQTVFTPFLFYWNVQQMAAMYTEDG